MKSKILEKLKGNEDFISGQEISKDFHMTRAAIWKYINILREEGYNIESVPSKGYRLVSLPDLLTYEEIREYLDTDFIGRNIHYFDSIDSTNKKAKEIALDEEEGTVLISEEQTDGKGRMGRDWVSPKGKGIWMTIILKPNIEPMKVPKLTLLGAAAVHKALDKMGIKTQIKWPNDILIAGKKICGILTEMSGELSMINYIIMGIGINVNLDEGDIPEELKDKASSLKISTGEEINRKELTANILNELEKLYISFKEEDNMDEVLKICRENSILLGEEVKIIRGNDIRLGKAIDIKEDGELLVKFEGDNIESIISGEVSLRGKDYSE
ncbi:MAG: biotin--[acetyl-CoA-carboxylase] ligase [Tissierellia bacterium]|nr:biotin--[acetyl-CoA-carboxylase] ligase [Tissierellia bacterium]